MKRLRLLTARAVVAIHGELIVRYGGAAGLRDEGGLQSALARVPHLLAYGEDVKVPELAAAYGWGLLRNHPFIDGNKRIALAAMVAFLELNGWDFIVSEAEETSMIQSAAAGEIDESAWFAWTAIAIKKKPRLKRED